MEEGPKSRENNSSSEGKHTLEVDETEVGGEGSKEERQKGGKGKGQTAP